MTGHLERAEALATDPRHPVSVLLGLGPGDTLALIRGLVELVHAGDAMIRAINDEASFLGTVIARGLALHSVAGFAGRCMTCDEPMPCQTRQVLAAPLRAFDEAEVVSD